MKKPPVAAAAEDDDPEFDLGERGKYKRSQLLNNIDRIRQAHSAEAKRAAEIQKRHDAQVSALQRAGVKDPERFMQDPQEYMRQMHHDYVRQQLEEADMDPRDIELNKYKQKEAERAEQERIAAEAQQKEQQTARVSARANEIASDMYEALDASNLPRRPEVVARMASLMLAAKRAGSDIPKAELAQRVAQSIATEQEWNDSQITSADHAARRVQPLLSHFKGDAPALAKTLGKELMEDLRKYILTEAQSKFSPPQQQSGTQRQHVAKPIAIPNRSHPVYHTMDELNALELAKRARR